MCLCVCFAAIPECGSDVLSQGHAVRVQDGRAEIPTSATATQALPSNHHRLQEEGVCLTLHYCIYIHILYIVVGHTLYTQLVCNI